MRILLISSFALRTPPNSYGGLERVWYEHSQGLADLGHDVTLIASKGSRAPKGVKLLGMVPTWNEIPPESQRAYAKADRVWNGWRAHEEEAYTYYKDLLGNYDVIGDASWSKWSYLSKKDEIVGTCHSIKPYNVKPPREYAMLTGVSKPHSRYLSAQLHIPVRTVWNPVNVDEFAFVKDKTDRILSLNRIMPQKGIHGFVKLAAKMNFKADVAGDDSTLVPDQAYVENIREQCKKSNNIVYHGLVTDAQRIKLLQEAKATIALIDLGYNEVFGLSIVESLACGTPVISLKSWGAEDIIENGKSGFLCSNMDEVEKAIPKIGEIKPEDCRARAELFKREVVTKQYEKMLTSVKGGSRW